MNIAEGLSLELVDAIAIVTLDRPHVHNALTPAMIQGLQDIFRELQGDEKIQATVITGAGGRAFSSGADLKTTIPEAARLGFDPSFSDPTKRFLSDFFKPVVAAVNGYCLAGGFELLLGTDIRIASRDAMFGLPEVTLGVIPSGGSHVRLPFQIPWAIAMELLLTGRPISATRALEVGLINEVVESNRTLPRAIEICEVICANGPLAVQAAKEIAVRSLDFERKFVYESERARRVFASNDAAKGAKDFAERSKQRSSPN